jgi:hypothetical protein
MPYLNLDAALAAAAPVITAGAPLTDTGKTLAQLRDELKVSLGNRDDYSPLQANTWINDAYLLIASGIKLAETSFGFSFNTIIGQPFYLLPAAVQYTEQLSLGDSADFPVYGGVPIQKIDQQIYRQLPDTDTDPRGITKAAFRFNRMLVVWPTPVSVHPIYVEGRVRPAPLTNDLDSPILPLEWHRNLLLKAKSFAQEDLEEFDNSERAQNSYVRNLREMGDPQAEEEADGLHTMRPVRRLSDLQRSRVAIEPGDGDCL